MQIMEITGGRKPEMPVNFWNVVLKKDVEDQLERSCGERSTTWSQGGQEYPTYNKKKTG
jgi:hypothetical protein